MFKIIEVTNTNGEQSEKSANGKTLEEAVNKISAGKVKTVDVKKKASD